MTWLTRIRSFPHTWQLYCEVAAVRAQEGDRDVAIALYDEALSAALTKAPFPKGALAAIVRSMVQSGLLLAALDVTARQVDADLHYAALQSIIVACAAVGNVQQATEIALSMPMIFRHSLIPPESRGAVITTVRNTFLMELAQTVVESKAPLGEKQDVIRKILPYSGEERRTANVVCGLMARLYLDESASISSALWSQRFPV